MWHTRRKWAPICWLTPVPTAQATSIQLFFTGLAIISRRIFRYYDHTTYFCLMDQPLTHFKVPSVEIGLEAQQDVWPMGTQVPV
jgi:hypothetical protein